MFIPNGKVGLFVRKFEAYADPAEDSKPKDPTKSGNPANLNLVASITQIRLAALESFWTDTGEFPSDWQPLWWEAWLREAGNPHDVMDVFRQRAQAAGVMVSQRSLRFPDRRVVLVRASVSQLLAVENLFDILAELRAAKILAREFLELPPRDQAEFIGKHCGELNRRHSMPPPFAIWTPASIVAIHCCRWHSWKSTYWRLIRRGQPLTAIISSVELEWRVWRFTVV